MPLALTVAGRVQAMWAKGSGACPHLRGHPLNYSVFLPTLHIGQGGYADMPPLVDAEGLWVGRISSACGVPILHPYLGERRVANEDRRMPAEERKPSAWKAEGRGFESRFSAPTTFRRAVLNLSIAKLSGENRCQPYNHPKLSV